MAATLAVRDAGEPVPTKDGISAALAEHLETHGGIGSDRVKSIVFGGLDGVSESRDWWSLGRGKGWGWMRGKERGYNNPWAAAL